MATIATKKQKFKQFQTALADLADDLSEMWGPLQSVYDALGISLDVEVDEFPTLTSSLTGELDPITAQYVQEAHVLASRLNLFNRKWLNQFYDPDGIGFGPGVDPPGLGNDYIHDQDWPENIPNGQKNGIVTQGLLNTEDFHNNVAGDLIVSPVLEDIKVILENKLINTPGSLADDYFDSPPDFASLAGSLEKTLDASGMYLQLLGKFGFTTKVDIPAAAPDAALPGPIPTDSQLESVLSLSANSTHYIAFLLDEQKSNQSFLSIDQVDGYYLPVRYSPYDQSNLPAAAKDNAAIFVKNWGDEKYGFIDNDAEIFDPGEDWKNSNGVGIEQGVGVIVTEIVDSMTGVWVGFVFDDTDEKISNGRIEELTRDRSRVLYTRPEYLRKKVSGPPDPLISHNIINTDTIAQLVEANLQDNKPSVATIAPGNQNWLNLLPEEAVLSYYNFIQHNRMRVQQYSVSHADIIENPALRYSEGFFYFIVGETTRKAGGNESEKITASKQSIADARDKAWNNLLKYLNKDRAPVNTQLYERLKNDFFVAVDTRVNTNSTSPNNQKVLFAIRSGYIDALPDSRRPYISDFDPADVYESQFAGGKNFAVAFYTKELRNICDDLGKTLKDVKRSSDAAKNAIIDANGQPFDMDIVLDFVRSEQSGFSDIPTVLANFLRNQAFPASTKQDFMSEFIKEAAASILSPSTEDPNHLIEIGIRDNKKEGKEVRETISYVLFSPDPEKLKEAQGAGESTSFNLFYFDPYVTDDELNNPDVPVRRSAIPLRLGINNLRQDFKGVYGSTALHYLLSYTVITNPKVSSNIRSGDSKVWTKLLQGYTVPPVQITANPEPITSELPGLEVNCDEWITELNSATNVWGVKERRLMEKVNKYCRKNYFDQFKQATPAGDPEMTRKELEKKAEALKNLDAKSSGRVTKALKFLYQNLLNNMDINSIISLIMACIQSKLGMPLTAEAICEAAIIRLVELVGVDKVEEVLLANALGDPERFGDVSAALSARQAQDGDKPLWQKGAGDTFTGAPIATFMTLLFQDWSGLYGPDGNRPEWLTPEVISVIKQLEQTNTVVDLVPGDRPGYTEQEGLSFPEDGLGGNLVENIMNSVYDDEPISLSPAYTTGEIEAERRRLLELGYTNSEAEGRLVYSGFLKPEETQYASLLSGGAISPLIAITDDAVQASQGTTLNTNQIRNVGATFQDAQNWLNYIKTIVDLQGLCELLVGSLLEGFEDLLRDPAGFISGGVGGWFDDFLENLKRRFSFPEPTFRFPDSLSTDTHMGGYGKKLLEALMMMVVTILAQILNLVIKDALLKCIEESDNDQGPANSPAANPQTIPIPSLDGIMAKKAPKVAGNLPYAAAAGMMDDILNNLSLGQLCSLLKGEATKQTLYNILQRVTNREDELIAQTQFTYQYQKNLSYDEALQKAEEDVSSSLRSINDIKNMFVALGKQVDLDICDVLSPTSAVLDDICVAFYDRDGKALELQEAGLTQEEADRQIDQDLQALKNKVFDYAPMLFPDGKGLGEGLNSVPDICDIPGAFQVPPGVEHTMNLVTDNILLNVKGSLIQDMTALKFFSVPPRAVLAATSPGMLKEAHSLFADAIRNPYQKICIAPLSQNYFGSLDIDESLTPVQSAASIYPIVYQLDGISYGEYQNKFPAYLNDGQLIEEYKNTAKDSPGVEDNMLEHDFFKPLTLLSLIHNPAFFQVYPDKAQYVRDVLTRAVPDKSSEIQNLQFGKSEGDNLVQKFVFDNLAAVKKVIKDDFSKDIKPKWLSEMVFELEHLKNKNIVVPSTIFNEQLFLDGQVISLDTKIKDLPGAVSATGYPGEIANGALFENYTGQQSVFFISPAGQGADGPVFALNPKWISQITIRPRDQWVEHGVVDYGQDNEFEDRKDDHRLSVSPGVASLLPHIVRLYKKYNSWPSSGNADRHAWAGKHFGNHAAPWAFMELTVGEAIGLTNERMRKILPKFPSMESVDGVIFSSQMEPLFVVFKQTYLDPSSILYKEDSELIDYFSLEKDPVNPELYSYLTDSNNFPQTLGFIDGAGGDQAIDDFNNLETYSNFNPNILRYDLPFTEIANASIEGSGGSTTIDGNQKIQDIFKMFTAQGTGAEIEEIDNLIQQLAVSTSQDSLIYQNAIGILEDEHIKPQIGPYREAYRMAKGKLTGIEGEDSIPPNILAMEESMSNQLFDISSLQVVDEDVQTLIKDLLYLDDPSNAGKTPTEAMINYWSGFQSLYAKAETPNESNKERFLYDLSSVNFKAQLFGRLLAHKWRSKFEEYDTFKNEEFAGYTVGGSLIMKNRVFNQLEYIFSRHSYSSLQFAYSNQMFAKLKRSRLQFRGMLKKLWDRVLSSPLGNTVNPACRDLFNQLNLQNSEDVRSSETDFFRVDDAKEEIKNYYKNALCKDVYEKNSPGENAVRVSLLQGVIKLMIKVYTLEMCIASIIAWDSFEVGQVFQTEAMTNTIIRNIEKDAEKNQNITKDKLALYATDIIKKEFKVKDEEQLAILLKENSAMGYLISLAAESISEIVSDVFQNSNPLSADLELDVLTNSDNDFNEKFIKNVLPTLGSGEDSADSHDPEKYRQLYALGGHEYVVDARFKQNIYTMNYGSGKTGDLLGPGSFDIDGQLAPGTAGQSDNVYMTKHYNNIYGFNKASQLKEGPGFYESKNFFHSLPYNYYQAIGENSKWGPSTDIPSSKILNSSAPAFDNYSVGFLDKSSPESSGDGLSVQARAPQYAYRVLSNYQDIDHNYYPQFIKINDLLTTHMGRADAFNKEMYKHTQMGNGFNGVLGNVTIQPYVKVEDWTTEDLLSEDYINNFTLVYYQQTAESGEQLDPCDNPFLTTAVPPEGVHDLLAQVNQFRNERINIFNSYIFDYVPLPVWSYFYNEIFLKAIFENQQMKDLYDTFGLAPFFKKVKFGLRLGYSTTHSVDQNVVNKDDEPWNLSEVMRQYFGPLSGSQIPGIENDVPAWGLKSSKTLFGHRPYYVPQKGDPDEEAKYKICDEIQVPIVEIEREINSVERTNSFTVGNDSTLIPLEKLGFYDDSTYDLFDGLIIPPEISEEQQSIEQIVDEDVVDAADAAFGFVGEDNAAEGAMVAACNEYKQKLSDYYHEIWAYANDPHFGTHIGVNNGVGYMDGYFFNLDPEKYGELHHKYNDLTYSQWTARVDFAKSKLEIKKLHPDFTENAPHPDYGSVLYKGHIEIGWNYPGPCGYIDGPMVKDDNGNWSWSDKLFGDKGGNDPWLPAVVGWTDRNLDYMITQNNKIGLEFINPKDQYGSPIGSDPPPDAIDAPKGAQIPTTGVATRPVEQQVVHMLNNPNAMKHLTNSFHQFFYKSLAQNMVDELKQSPEFKLMYDHLFPMKRYMTLAFMFASDSLSKFIPEPTDILDVTKNNLAHIISGLESALGGDYTFLPDPLANYLQQQLDTGRADTRAKNPNLRKQIMMIILRTPLLILKGFVETTDPAIIVAKAVIDIANAIQQTVIATIETGISTAKQAVQAAKMTADMTMNQIEGNIKSIVASLDSAIDMGLNFNIPLSSGQSGGSAADYITLSTDGPVDSWVIQMDPLPQNSVLEQEQLDTWEKIKADLEGVQKLQSDYVGAKNKSDELEAKLSGEISKLEEELKEAKKVLKDIFKSPLLLPGLWAAMLPPILPLGGGLIPPPLPSGPFPSTVPGMIYLVLMFLDSWEEQQEKQAKLANEDESCEDEL